MAGEDKGKGKVCVHLIERLFVKQHLRSAQVFIRKLLFTTMVSVVLYNIKV